MTYRTFLLLVFFLTGWQQSQPTNPGSGAAQTPYTEKFEREIRFYPGGKVKVLAGVAGNFKIVGWKKAAVRVEAEKIFYQVSPDEAKKVSEQYPIRVKSDQTDATIQTISPSGVDSAVEVNVTVWVPKEKTDLKIELLKGDLAISDLNGWVEASLLDGSVEVKSVQGYFSVMTHQGDLQVELDSKRWIGHSLTAGTQRGSATLRLPVEYSAALQLESRGGNISIDYPEQLVDGEKVPLNVVTKKEVRSLTATVGEGGAPIRIFSKAGDIHLFATRNH